MENGICIYSLVSKEKIYIIIGLDSGVMFTMILIFISLADDGCNTAIESFQTDRLLRVFHSCYFHYSEYIIIIQSD